MNGSLLNIGKIFLILLCCQLHNNNIIAADTKKTNVRYFPISDFFRFQGTGNFKAPDKFKCIYCDKLEGKCNEWAEVVNHVFKTHYSNKESDFKKLPSLSASVPDENGISYIS